MTAQEIFVKAVVNTLLGMGTVFLMLIIISVCIYLFKFIQPKNDEKETNVAVEKEMCIENDLMDDTRLIAIITAAITSYNSSDAPAGEFQNTYVVKSARRRN